MPVSKGNWRTALHFANNGAKPHQEHKDEIEPTKDYGIVPTLLHKYHCHILAFYHPTFDIPAKQRNDKGKKSEAQQAGNRINPY